MKRFILITAVLLSLFACNKDDSVDNEKKFSTEEKELLKILNGKWKKESNYSSETLSFEPFNQQKEVNGSAGGVMYFHGNATRKFYYVDNQSEEWKMYFYIDTKKKEIAMYGVDNGKYSIIQTKSYDYNIINNSTIELHDKSLSWTHTYSYKRIK